MAELKTDVLVLGTGIAGTTAASLLAQRGLSTVMAGPPTQESDDYDVLLTNSVLQLVTSERLGRPINALEVTFDQTASTGWTDAGLTVCRMTDLLNTAADRATALGARRLVGRATTNSRRATLFHTAAGEQTTLAARHVIIATGSDTGPSTGMVCARRFKFPGPEYDRALLDLVAPDETDPRSAPLSVRVLPAPGAPGVISVSVTTTAPTSTEPGHLLDIGLAALNRVDERYRSLVPAGPVRHAALTSAFAPTSCLDEGQLVIGGATGLLNPFTGESIANAVHSARLAADAISHYADDPEAAGKEYLHAVSRTFVGYSESLRHAARKYHLAWRILAATADDDNAFFAKGRKAVLLPGGFAALGGDTEPDAPGSPSIALAPFVAACSEVAIAAVREEWPFVASIVASDRGTASQALRPATMFGAASCAGGAAPDNRWAGVGAAIELTMLGMLALTATAASVHRGHRGVDWPSASAVLAGDHLLAQAGLLVAKVDADLASPFAAWLAELAMLRTTQLHKTGDPRPFFGALFEFPARLGAELGRATGSTVAVLREFGRHCGNAFVHAEDLLGLAGRDSRLDTTLDGRIKAGFSALPALLDQPITDTQLRGPLRQRATETSRTLCLDEERTALTLLARLPDNTARHILSELCTTLAEPAHHTEGK
ncbi:FAD-dependent oxidoreductase [Amycolatopsis sp. NPDC049691]|uniref:FAD-dependent oxidoreductase n=1 Tax=Amycolatopsis sp. NPDC049691 TaxID=3155155 RepID=UPI00341ECBA9